MSSPEIPTVGRNGEIINDTTIIYMETKKNNKNSRESVGGAPFL